jgi:hypothetical protein
MRQASSRFLERSLTSAPPKADGNRRLARIIPLVPAATPGDGHLHRVAELFTRVVSHVRELAATEEASPSLTPPSPPNVVAFPRVGVYRHPSYHQGPRGGAA